MSKINGDKARTAVEKRRRTAQRAKDRAKLAEIKSAAVHPAEKKTNAK
jgi:hypothetical protein